MPLMFRLVGATASVPEPVTLTFTTRSSALSEFSDKVTVELPSASASSVSVVCVTEAETTVGSELTTVNA